MGELNENVVKLDNWKGEFSKMGEIIDELDKVDELMDELNKLSWKDIKYGLLDKCKYEFG